MARRKLHAHLLELCRSEGISFLEAEVTDVNVTDDGHETHVSCSNGTTYHSRLVTLASGAAAGKFLKFESNAPVVAAQTAYGIEAEVEGYAEGYNPELMLFMDFRRHHSGVFPGAAPRLQVCGDGGSGQGVQKGAFLFEGSVTFDVVRPCVRQS